MAVRFYSKRKEFVPVEQNLPLRVDLFYKGLGHRTDSHKSQKASLFESMAINQMALFTEQHVNCIYKSKKYVAMIQPLFF